MAIASASAIRAGAAYVELFLKDKLLVKGLNAAAAKLKAFGKSVTALGKKLTTLGLALAVPFFTTPKIFANMGSDLLNMSERTGVAVEALSELQYAAEQSGASVEDLEMGLRAMSKNIFEAAMGSTAAQRSLAMLGLRLRDLIGLSPDQQFELIADRLSRIQNPALRTALAMEIFGRSGTKLLPLISRGAQGIEELRREAQRLGLTMSSEDAQAARAFGDALGILWKSLKQVAFMIGAALAPTLQELAQWLTGVAGKVKKWIDQNREIVKTIGLVILGIVGVGAALLVLGPIISGIGVGIGLVSSAISALAAIIGFLLSPIGAIIVGILGIGSAILFATDEGNRALGSLRQGFEQVRGAAVTTWQGIVDAIMAGDLAGAMEVAWLGLKVVWFSGIAALQASWRNFKSFFVELFWTAVYAVARAVNMGWTTIEVAFWMVVDSLATGWDIFCAKLQIAFSKFVAFFRRAWARVRNLFDQETAEREVEAINQELEQQIQATNEQLDQRIRERQRQARADKAAERGVRREQELNKMQEEERRQRQREIDEANAADQERVAQAQEALKKRAEELAVQRKQVEMQREQERARAGPSRPSVPEFDLSGLERAVAKIDVRGTFNPFAVAGLGSESGFNPCCCGGAIRSW